MQEQMGSLVRTRNVYKETSSDLVGHSARLILPQSHHLIVNKETIFSQLVNVNIRDRTKAASRGVQARRQQVRALREFHFWW